MFTDPEGYRFEVEEFLDKETRKLFYKKMIKVVIFCWYDCLRCLINSLINSIEYIFS